MPTQQIDNAYLRGFFGIGTAPEDDAELAAIRSKLVRLQFSHGQDICTIDAEPDGMFFLESGAALVLDRDGEQINVLHEGQYFGEYAVLSGQRRLSTVRSLGRTVVWRMNNEDMLDVLRRHPDTYGELMKRVYGEVSRKHAQLLTLSRMQRGILQDPDNRSPMSPRRMLLHYGILAVIFLLAALLIPAESPAPVFLLPLVLMLVHVLITRRTLESLVVSGMLAAVLVYRGGLAASYADALIASMSSPDNAFTVLVMALMGGVVTLIEASGAVTAFKKLADRKLRSPRGVRFATLGILAVTAIDDCLNLLCAASGLRSAAEKQRVPREDSALLLSLLPTPLCSFLPFSLWGIFVIGTINASTGGQGAALFCRAIPFNFFSILAVAAALLFCSGRLPLSRRLRAAHARVDAGGTLWPEGSERYLLSDETDVWGRISNLLLPVAALAVSSLLLRSLRIGSFVLDSACGLVATLVFMFFLYCLQRLMSPEQFFEHLISGIQSMVLPIVLYLLSMCFSSLLELEAMDDFFAGAVQLLGPVSALIPAVLFLLSVLFTVALGSSWAMFVIAFPVALRMAAFAGVSLPLCLGAVCAAGIAGEKLCFFTSESLSVGSAIGCDPRAALDLRLQYSFLLALVSLLLYLLAGFLF